MTLVSMLREIIFLCLQQGREIDRQMLYIDTLRNHVLRTRASNATKKQTSYVAKRPVQLEIKVVCMSNRRVKLQFALNQTIRALCILTSSLGLEKRVVKVMKRKEKVNPPTLCINGDRSEALYDPHT